jgi:AcrR family transcriptional regulator
MVQMKSSTATHDSAQNGGDAPTAKPGARSAHDQRERLLDGIAQAVARRGYTDATIAHAVAFAGVSRTTFYEHFDDKEACFLAAYRELARQMGDELRETLVRTPWVSKTPAALSHLLDSAGEESFAPWRLLLSQARGGGVRVREERERFVAKLEDLLEQTLDDRPADAFTLDVPAKALLGGVRSVISIRRYQGAMREHTELIEDLHTWTSSYSVPSGHPRHDRAAWTQLMGSVRVPTRHTPQGGGPRRSLPRGSGRLPRDVVAREHYDRIVSATARVIRAKGYAALTTADITTAANISRSVFYAQFLNKQEAFLAVQTASTQRSMAATARAFFDAPAWPQRVWDGLGALLQSMASAPDFTYAAITEPNAAGSAALQRLVDTLSAFKIFLQEGYSQRARARQLPPICSDAITGAIFEIIYHYTYGDRIAQLPQLLPQLAYIALAPFVGPEQAGELVEAQTQATARVDPASAVRRSTGHPGHIAGQ